MAFDTSAAHCAAALLLPDGQCLLRHEDMAKGQAERLLPLLEQLLADAGLTWQGVTLLGVGTGPGNFTGVRIAVAAARGLSLALRVPAIGVTRFEAAAYGLPRPITVIEDARRDEIYVQRFTRGGPEPAAMLTLTDFHSDDPVTGTGAALLGMMAQVQPVPMVQAIAHIAAAHAGTQHPRPAPFYLRGADAAPPSDPPPVILDA